MTVTGNYVMEVKFDKNKNNPQILEEYVKRVKANSVVHMTFMPEKVDDAWLKFALLKTAYLLMFETYGYAFIFDKQYDRVRDQLMNPNEKIYPLDFWLIGPFPESLDMTAPFLIDESIGSIMPFFQLKTEKSKYMFSAILPINSRPIEDIIEGFKAKFRENKRFSAKMDSYGQGKDVLKNVEDIRKLFDFVGKLT